MCIMSEEAVHLRNVRHRIAPGITLMLDGLRVEAGESLALTGPSGCGKSTLLHLIAGLTKSEQGSVEVLRTEMSSLGTAALDRFRGRHIGLVFQSFHLLPAFTALENVLIGLRFGGNAAHRPRAIEMLERVGLSHRLNTRTNRLSVGERQRVAIARALAGKPEILLADEPTGSLDPKTGRQIFDLMCGLARENSSTFLMVTHDPALAAELSRQFDCSKLIHGEEVAA